MKEISKAILEVTKWIEGVSKDTVVWIGNNSYKGISEKMVKTSTKQLMIKNWLSIIPISVTPTRQIDRWEEDTQYWLKQKQSVFTDVTTKYLLLHTSWESIELAGYGQWVDTQDKGAGKATTYALKNTLMNTFMMITWEDTEDTHSNDLPVPKKQYQDNDHLPWIAQKNIDNLKKLVDEWQVFTIKDIRAKYKVSKDNAEILKNLWIN